MTAIDWMKAITALLVSYFYKSNILLFLCTLITIPYLKVTLFVSTFKGGTKFCAACDSSDVCTSCLDSMRLTSAGPSCVACLFLNDSLIFIIQSSAFDDMFYISGSDINCDVCADYADQCLSCATGYYADGPFACKQCKIFRHQVSL
jgi:hypothetical protein